MTATTLDALCRAAAARGEVVLYLPPHVRRYPDGIVGGWHPPPGLVFVAVRPPGGVK